MILGIPTIASEVGGIYIIEHKKEGFFINIMPVAF